MSQQHQSQSSYNAKTCPTVGQDVLAVGFENEGIGPPAGADEIVAETRIDDSSHQDQNKSRSQVLQLEPGNPLANRLNENRNRGYDDQGSFKSGGKEGDPLVTVEEMMGSRLCAETETEGGKPHSDHM